LYILKGSGVAIFIIIKKKHTKKKRAVNAMPRTYKKHHHTHHKRRHYRHHIQRPLVATKHYVRITARQVLAVAPATNVGPGPGEWSTTVAVAWQQPVGLFGSTYYGFNFSGSEFLAQYKQYEQYSITGCRIEYTPAQFSSAGVG